MKEGVVAQNAKWYFIVCLGGCHMLTKHSLSTTGIPKGPMG